MKKYHGDPGAEGIEAARVDAAQQRLEETIRRGTKTRARRRANGTAALRFARTYFNLCLGDSRVDVGDLRTHSLESTHQFDLTDEHGNEFTVTFSAKV